MKSILVASALATVALAPAASAQTALTTTTYTEDFNSLARTGTTGTALPAGFAFVETGSGANNSYGISQITTTTGLTGGAYSFGFATTAADRAFGSIASDTVTSVMFGFLFTNGLSGTITGFDINYLGEQWRRGTAASGNLVFEYSTDATSLTNGTWTAVNSLNFAAPSIAGGEAQLNGNLGSFRTNLSGTIGGLNIAQGANFAFRWTDMNVTGGSNHGLAIDDVTITTTLAAAVPEPATWAMMMLGFGAMGVALRRRPKVSARIRFA